MKEKVANLTARNGYRYCKKCYRDFPLSHFYSSRNRRETLTANCASCRAILSKASTNKTTKRGKCRQVWLDWKKKKCELCDYEGDNIEADHRPDRGQKIYHCSSYKYWSHNGGPEALKAELEKLQPVLLQKGKETDELLANTKYFDG